MSQSPIIDTLPIFQDRLRHLLDSLNQNPNIYLPAFQQDSIFDPDKYSAYLDQFKHQNQELYKIVRTILESTVFIDFSTFLSKLTGLMASITQTEFSILIDLADPAHSETWCLVLIWPLIKHKVKHIFGRIEDVTDQYPLLLVDDCIYTGARLSHLLARLSRSTKIQTCLSVLICVPFAHLNYSAIMHIRNNGLIQYQQYVKEYTVDFSKLQIANYYIAHTVPSAFALAPDRNEDTYNLAEIQSELLNLWVDPRTSILTLPIIFQHRLAGPESTFETIYKQVFSEIPDRSYLTSLLALQLI